MLLKPMKKIMIKYENDCVDCGLPCFDTCKYKNVPHYYCDCCGEETDELYIYDDGRQLCADCLLSQFDKI